MVIGGEVGWRCGGSFATMTMGDPQYPMTTTHGKNGSHGKMYGKIWSGKLVIAWCIADGEIEATEVTSAPSMAVIQGADIDLLCFVLFCV